MPVSRPEGKDFGPTPVFLKLGFVGFTVKDPSGRGSRSQNEGFRSHPAYSKSKITEICPRSGKAAPTGRPLNSLQSSCRDDRKALRFRVVGPQKTIRLTSVGTYSQGTKDGESHAPNAPNPRTNCTKSSGSQKKLPKDSGPLQNPGQSTVRICLSCEDTKS